uniref:Ig-like domain-containing protein n=1 Tax=Anabas testudineus TaxID=64144 RepID=A0AAQ6IKG6_ANATE
MMVPLLLLLFLKTQITRCEKNGSEVVTVTEKEGRDVILPCSLRTKTSVESKIFDWRKDGQKEVFRYDAGLHDNNGLGGQNKQFRGRVSYFQEELKNGNASIIIRSITTADRGVYTCDFPRLQPRQKFYIKLIVDAVLKPCVTILSETKDGVQLQCEVVGTYPGIKLKIGWQDGSGNNLTEKEIQKTERGESYILNTTVTKSGYYRCVATQEEIKHQVYTETYVPVHGEFLCIYICRLK